METDRTILFADICQSTGITERLGDVASRQLIAELLQDLISVTEQFHGTVIKTMGDEIMTAFESPSEGVGAGAEMQRVISARTAVRGVRPEIRVGLHAGPVLSEGGDVFGDVVNVSARVVAKATAGQVLTTADTLDRLGDEGTPWRSLGEHTVKGRREPLHLCEILWRGETAQMTILAPKLEMETTPGGLELRLGDQVVSITGDLAEPITLGRGVGNSLVDPGTSASRSHADITCRGGRFYLADHSTNGTYVRPEGQAESFVHRDEVLLQGSGFIRLGGSFSEMGPKDISFKTT